VFAEHVIEIVCSPITPFTKHISELVSVYRDVHVCGGRGTRILWAYWYYVRCCLLSEVLDMVRNVSGITMDSSSVDWMSYWCVFKW
jgi:hypothetical protein